MLNVECCVCDVSSAKVSWWLHTLAVMCVCICVHMCCLQFVCCLCEICGATKRTLLCCFLSLRLLFFFFFLQFSASALCCCCGFNGGNGWFMCRSVFKSPVFKSPVYSLQSTVFGRQSSLFTLQSSQCAMAKDNAVWNTGSGVNLKQKQVNTTHWDMPVLALPRDFFYFFFLFLSKGFGFYSTPIWYPPIWDMFVWLITIEPIAYEISFQSS